MSRDYPISDLGEMHEGARIVFETSDDSDLDDVPLEVADVVQVESFAWRVTFHDATLRLWQVRDYLYVTNRDDEIVEKLIPLSDRFEEWMLE